MKRASPPLAALLMILALPLRAEVILDLRFDDAEHTVSSHPEGVTSLSPAQIKAGVTSGKGGVGAPNLTPKTGVDVTAGEESAKFQIAQEPAIPGAPTFLRASFTEGSQYKMIGARITHDSPDTSLSAMAKVVNGRLHLDGGLDFFFRLGADAADYTGKINLWAKLDQLTFTLSSEAEGGKGLRAALSCREPVFALNGAQTPSKQGAQSRFTSEVPLRAGEIYHAAVRFTTSADGLITVEVFLQEGGGAIKAGTTTLNSVIEGIRIFPAEAVPSETDRITINLADQGIPQSLDLAAIRIFKPAPDIFPALIP